MTRAIDPFEEFLRKKKVEMLEQRYRGDPPRPPAGSGGAAGGTGIGIGAPATADEEEALVIADDDPEAEARLRVEMDDFFLASQSAGAQLYTKVDTGISNDKVDEIRDALDDVFEEDAPAPQTEDNNDTFVNFFRQVQERYEDEIGPASAAPAAPADVRVRATVPPAAPEPKIDGRSAHAPTGSPLSAAAAATVAAADPAPETAGGAMDALAELAREEAEVTRPRARSKSRLDLSEILAGPVSDADARQRIDLLCRIVAKLVERVGLPENEIIEVLIKSGVEF